MRPLLLSLLFCCLVCIPSPAITHYATVHNQFGSLVVPSSAHTHVKCRDNVMIVDNGSCLPLLVRDTFELTPTRMRVQARLANKHNNPRSSYSVTDDDNRRYRIDAPQWGIFIAPAANSDNYWSLTAQCANSNINDEITDQRSMTVTLAWHPSNGIDSVITTCPLTRGVNLYYGLNTFQLELRDGTLTAWAGDDELQELFSVPFALASARATAGCYVGSGAEVEVERFVVSCDSHPTLEPSATWTTEELDQHFADSDDPLEGYWHYQDRDVDDRYLRLGGRYTVAIVRAGDHYEIIYIDGAETRPSQWRTGMLKGRITRTIFSDHYDLMWIDATGEPITQDAYATFENGVLLTLQFPVYKSQMRLSKMLHP